jgi:NADP-dependent 3-hydroxy acid dehydrogenase YdfG
MKALDAKVAAITGAGSGIGRSLALELAGRGMRLALSDVNVEALDETISLCGSVARAYPVDVADAGAVQAWADAVVADFGQVNLVVNNAGVSLTGDILDISLDDIGWVFDIDFWGVVHGTKAFLPHLIASGDGHVVNISSVFGLLAVPSQGAYNAAKFAVRGFTEALRQEMVISGHPIGVTSVHPGGIRTNVVRNSRVVGFDHAQLVSQFDALLAKTTSARAASVIVRGIERDRARVLIGTDAYALDAMVRILGPRYQKVVTSRVARMARTTQLRRAGLSS